MARTLYLTFGSPPCRAVLMTFEVLNIEVDKRALDMLNGEHLQDWFLQLNPCHRVPTLDDNGFVLWESRSIMRYLVNSYGTSDDLYPRDVQKRALVDKMLDFDIGLYTVVKNYTRPQVFELAEENLVQKDVLCKELEILETLLKRQDGQWLVGDNMTIADLSVVCSLSFLEVVDFDFSAYKNVARWRQEMRNTSFYQNVNEKYEEFKKFVKSPKWREMMQGRLKQ